VPEDEDLDRAVGDAGPGKPGLISMPASSLRVGFVALDRLLVAGLGDPPSNPSPIAGGGETPGRDSSISISTISETSSGEISRISRAALPATPEL